MKEKICATVTKRERKRDYTVTYFFPGRLTTSSVRNVLFSPSMNLFHPSKKKETLKKKKSKMIVFRHLNGLTASCFLTNCLTL